MTACAEEREAILRLSVFCGSIFTKFRVTDESRESGAVTVPSIKIEYSVEPSLSRTEQSSLPH